MKTLVREKRWHLLPQNSELQSKFSKELKTSPVIGQILINRGINNLQDANNFLKKDVNALYNSFIFEDMDVITKRILSAIAAKEDITIYGDYDADGICGTAVLFSVISELGGKCSYYLPSRIDEGYGLNSEAILKFRDNGTKLLITVDCGISSSQEIDYAQSLGMDVIVTDHHMPVGELPKCIGILNPKIQATQYPYKDLAGVGVVYKLASALSSITKKIDVKKYLDLVAVGTIADIVPLTGENRVLVSQGLKVLENTNRTGLIKLKEKSGVNKDIQASHVAFRLAPRINASGRLSTAETSIKLLLTQNELEAEEYSTMLNKNNRERQEIEQEVLDSALSQLELRFNFNSDKVIVLENREWPVGVIGIVAGRIANQYHRPCIIISLENGMGKGSGRSIRNFHLLEALQACKEHLKKFGGHSHAAGLSIEELLVQPFREGINKYAETVLNPEDLIPTIDIDVEAEFKDISFELIEQIDTLEPFGQHNPKPCLLSRNVQLYSDPQIVKDDHLKFKVKSQNRIFDVIGFGMADYISLFDESSAIDIVYRPQINNWMNKQIIQLQLVDIKVNNA